MTKVYVLRTCAADMSSRRGFVWPSSGFVEAPDWSPEPICGGGLHGWLWGEGDGHLGDWGATARWLVVEVDDAAVVDLDGKVKFPRGEVVFCGDRLGATSDIIARGARGAVIGATLTGGHGATLTGGHGATLTGGHGATLTGGYRATLTGGNGATLTGGYGATLTGGDNSTLTGGDNSTLTGGYRATLTGGYGATLTGGDGAILMWRCARVVAFVGNDGIDSGVPYRIVHGKPERVR